MKKVIGGFFIIYLNFVTFAYFISDTNIQSKNSNIFSFLILFLIGSVAFGYAVKRWWWLVFLGGLSVLFLGIRAAVLTGIDLVWWQDFARFLIPIVIMEVFSLTGYLIGKINFTKETK